MGNAVRPIKSISQEIDLIECLKEEDKRAYIIYLMLRYTGFRISDILPLKVRDVKGKNEIEIKEQKTKNRVNKQSRKVLIHADLKEELEKYIKNKSTWQVLFPSNKGENKPLSYVQAYRILKGASKKVGIKNFGTHSGRKTCAYYIYQNTEDLDIVKNFLMHDNARDTIRYVGLEQEVRDNTISKIESPLSILKKL